MFFVAQGNIGPATTEGSNEVANFLFTHHALIVTILVLLVAITIALVVFLTILWKYYKKDELILRKYKINPADEDYEELKKNNIQL